MALRILNRLTIYTLLAGCLFAFGCNSSQEIPGFDANQWKDDRNACANKREALMETLRKNPDLLKGLSEPELNATLGTPDKINLGTRNLKSYWYFIKPGSQCDQSNIALGPYLTVRFNAVGLSYEVLFPN